MKKEEIISALQAGQIIAHPADTCFGLAADLMNKKVVQKIQYIKGREKLKPMSIMLPVTSISDLADWVILTDFSWQVVQDLCPGPVTLLLPKGPKIPEHYFPETSLIGIRIPDDLATQDLLESFGGPLITTSANRSGELICFDSECVEKEFENQEHQPDLIVKGKCNQHASASTVLMIHEHHVEIMREGPITENDLKDLGIPIQ